MPVENINNDIGVFSGLDFLSTFFSLLKTKNVNVVSSDKLFTIIGKYRDEFLGLFVDIDIMNNCGTICSHELEEGISMLQILGAVSKSNPRYERIILKMHKETANEMIDKCQVDYCDEIKRFVDIFLEEINGK